jgi:cation transport ATPase
VFVTFAAAAVWFRVWEPLAGVSVIGLVGAIVGGWPIFTEAWENIRERRMTMELSMTIALVAALVIGEFFTALVITAFVPRPRCWKDSPSVAAVAPFETCSNSCRPRRASGVGAVPSAFR